MFRSMNFIWALAYSHLKILLHTKYSSLPLLQMLHVLQISTKYNQSLQKGWGEAFSLLCQWECELRHSFYNLTICIKCTINFMSFSSLITLVPYPKEMIRDTQRAFYNKDVNPSSIYKIWKLQKCQTMEQYG